MDLMPENVIIDFSNEINSRHKYDTNLYQQESKIISNLTVPGIARYQMPAAPEKSANVRKAALCKLNAATQIPLWDLNQGLEISRFETLLETLDFSNRVYEERLGKESLTSIISKAMLFEPDTRSYYEPDTDSLLLAVYYDTPSTRKASKKWNIASRARPSFANWLKEVPEEQEFLDIDEKFVGEIWEDQKVAFPVDKSIFKQFEYTVGPEEVDEHLQAQTKNLNYVVKDDIMYGFHSDGSLWIHFDDKARALIQKEDDDLSLTLTMPNGLQVKHVMGGNILQQLSPDLVAKRTERGIKDEHEENRVITGAGSVLKYLPNDKIHLLMANGNVGMKSGDTWTSTNNTGLRRSRVGEDEDEVGYIPYSEITDPQSKAVTMLREDRVMKVDYQDGSSITLHEDSTSMHNNAEGDTILVESLYYASTEIHKTPYEVVVDLPDQSTSFTTESEIRYRRQNGFELVIHSQGAVLISTFAAGEKEQLNVLKPGVHQVDMGSGVITTIDAAGIKYQMNLEM